MSDKKPSLGRQDIQELIKNAQARAAGKIATSADPGNYHDHSTEGLALTGDDQMSAEVSPDAKDKTQDMVERAPGDTPDNAAPLSDLENPTDFAGNATELEPTRKASLTQEDPGTYEGETDPELKIANFKKDRDDLAKIACQLISCLDGVLGKTDAPVATARPATEVKEASDDTNQPMDNATALEEGFKVAGAFFDIESSPEWAPAVYNELLKNAHVAERCANIIADRLDETRKIAEMAVKQANSEGSELVDEAVAEEDPAGSESLEELDIPVGDVGGEEALDDMSDVGDETIDPALIEEIAQALIAQGLIDEEGGDLIEGDDLVGAFDDAGLAPEELALINDKTGSAEKTVNIMKKVARSLSKKATQVINQRQSLIYKLASQVTATKNAKAGKTAKKVMSDIIRHGKRGA